MKCSSSRSGCSATNRICGIAIGIGLAAFSLSGVAQADLFLSEVYYDAVGSDNGVGFVELFGTPGESLDGVEIVGVNGSNGSETPLLGLSGFVPDDGFYVVADDSGDGSTFVIGADLILNFDFQNGPDSVVLRAGGSTLDALGYGEFDPDEFFFGEGVSAPDAAAGSSLARVFANLDTNDNSADFISAIPSPGEGPLTAIPEPGSACLLLLGLVGLERLGRARSEASTSSRG